MTSTIEMILHMFLWNCEGLRGAAASIAALVTPSLVTRVLQWVRRRGTDWGINTKIESVMVPKQVQNSRLFVYYRTDFLVFPYNYSLCASVDLKWAISHPEACAPPCCSPLSAGGGSKTKGYISYIYVKKEETLKEFAVSQIR